MTRVRHTLFITVIIVMVLVLQAPRRVGAQEPYQSCQVDAGIVAATCPPDFQFGCTVTGSAAIGLQVQNSATTGDATAVIGRMTAGGAPSSSAGILGRNHGLGSGVYGIAASGCGVIAREALEWRARPIAQVAGCTTHTKFLTYPYYCFIFTCMCLSY